MSKILVTGRDGLCGSALREEVCKKYGLDLVNQNIIQTPKNIFYFAGRDTTDLKKEMDVRILFDTLMPDVVIHTAATVGGIGGNEAYHESFFYDNILMNLNIVRNCIRCGVSKLFAFSSVCVFPDSLELLEEDKMHDGPVFDSNFAYGYAKRMIDVHIRAAQKQWGVENWTSIIPGNIFGKHDMYSIEHGHIIPSLTHKLYLSKQNGEDFQIWGDGQSYREFIYVNDLARILLELVDKPEIPDKIIVSGRDEHRIADVVDMMVDIAGFDGNVVYQTDQPNGQRRRPSSKKVIDELLPDFQYTDIRSGLKESWEWFCDNYPNVRKHY